GLKGRRFDGQAKRLLYSGQTWKSYAGLPSPRGHGLADILNMYDNQYHATFRGAAAGPQFSCIKSQF
ncbi:hypothetical protein, partial [uncultured Dialister sp.]|uniref:hypothetical protein n=1 Tax=uncultured Dialister sp. TaxID=278064 RepID=UPI0025E58268